jgi:flagellar motor switch protein FliM
MEKILNQDEIDALFHAAQDRSRERGSLRVEDKHVTACNFRRAGLITRDQLRAVNLLHETFVRNLTRSLAAYLRVAFEVNLVSTEQITYSEFLQHVPEVNYVVSTHLRPFDAMAAVELDLQLAFPMIDLLLGGPGKAVGETREVTEVEEEILKGVVQLICRELQATWQPVIGAEFEFDERQRQTQILRLMPPNEKVLSLSYEIRMSEVSGMLVTAFPAVAANALIRKLAQQGSYRKHRPGFAMASSLREKLKKCSFSVELLLPGGTVGSRQLLALEKGSILALHLRAHEPAVLYVEKQALFTAQPVRRGNRRAAQVVQQIGTTDFHRSEKIEQ